ncbi:MAG TPA: polysaccharide deacetylase family protein [bacterium]|nr:polysaccharide deacetylase family protein [bacterium]HPN44932.1 polysaccharide deacetylase family protein [bacterium]
MLEENKLKRFFRNVLAAMLALFLIMLGYTQRAKKQYLQNGCVLSIFFHNPPRRLFLSCIKWLKKNGFYFISTQQLIDFLYLRTPLLPGAVWITFDDGWKNNLTQVMPTIKQYQIPITFFIPTGEIENGAFWFCEAIKHKNLLPEELQINPFEKLLQLTNHERQRIINELYRNDDYTSPENGEPFTLADINELAALPYIGFGSHTVNHVVTTNCAREELDFEIQKSRLVLEQWLGVEITAFAYPNGNYDGREKAILQKYGYKIAATIEEHPVTYATDPFLVPRNCVLDDGSFAENLCHLLGVWTPFIIKLKRLTSWALNLPQSQQARTPY